ncbi:MAG: hypothetical protein ACXW2C_10395 [Acidimicrobiia bacterium]
MDASFLAVICVGACVLAIVLIVVAPWRRVRDEPPLEPDVQTRLLLGDAPEDVAAEAEAAEADQLAQRPEPPVELPRRPQT